MVGVEVRQQQQWDPAHTQVAQAVVHGAGVRSRVDHDGRTRAHREDAGVPLADGALYVGPVGRRPALERTRELWRPQDGQEQQHGQGGAEPAMAPPSDAQHQQGGRGGGEQQSAEQPARPGQLRPRQSRPGPRHRGDPPGGHSGTPGEPLGGGHPQRGHRERREAEHRGGSRREFGEQVARHRHEAHPGGEHDDHRRAHRLGGRGGPHRVGEPGPHPPPLQRFAPPGAEGEQGPRGQYGQQEADAAGQPGVVQQQQQNGGGEGRKQRPAPPGGEGQQGDGPAGGGPQHAGLRPAHHHEARRQRRSAQGGGPQRQPEPGCQSAAFRALRGGRGPDEQEQHHGQVRSRHGEQVQQIGGLEGVVQVGRHPGGVPDHQAGEQCPGVGPQPLGGFPQAGPQRPRDALRDVRPARHPRRGVAGEAEQCHGPLPLAARRQPAHRLDPGGGQQPGPALVPGQDPYRGLDAGTGPVGAGHPGHHRVQGHGGRPASAADGTGVRLDGEFHRDPGVPPGGALDGSGACLGPLEPGHPGSGRRAQQGGGEGGADPPRRPRSPEPGEVQPAGDGHREAHSDGGPPARCPQRDGRGRPRGQRRREQAQVRGTGPLDRVHGRTSARRSENRRSPTPSTCRSSSTDRKPPRAVRKSMMCCASTGPTPGSPSSCSTVAPARLSGPAPEPEPPPRLKTPAPHPDRERRRLPPAAVRERPP